MFNQLTVERKKNATMENGKWEMENGKWKIRAHFLNCCMFRRSNSLYSQYFQPYPQQDDRGNEAGSVI